MIPTFLEYLAEAYHKDMRHRNQQAGPDVDPIAVEQEMAKTENFRRFCEQFLSHNRASQMGYAGDTYLITLTNGDQVLLCPTADGRFEPGDGRTTPANYIPVTGQETYQELRRSTVGEAPHFKNVGEMQDLSLPHGQKRYDQ